MTYTLITKQGQIMQFYVKGVAELYQTIKGGTLFTADILVDRLAQNSYTSFNS